MPTPAPLNHFGIIGGGAWGTALGQTLLRARRDVLLWAREPEVATAITATHENATFLPGVNLNTKLVATNDLNALASCDAWLVVTPTQFLRHACEQLVDKVKARPRPVIIACKGVEQRTLALPSHIVREILGNIPVAVLSGPSFAREVACDKPAALTLACEDETLGQNLVNALSSRHFRLYYSADVTGAQIGGAIKNVLAIACGIVTGCDMGENARAALITRGLMEMMRLALAMGARRETLMGLSGAGDLILTCSSTQSRNASLGMALGRGDKLADILATRNSVAEGVFTTAAALALAQKHHVEMPIVEAVDSVLNHGASVTAAVEALLTRPLKTEWDETP